MNQQHINYERVAEAIEYIGANFRQQPDLAEVAQQVHLSPEHFQRLFTDWAGVSPKKFMQFLTLDYLRERICEVPNLQTAADEAGLSAQSRVYDLFVNIEGVTPGTFREAGRGLQLKYGYHNTPFGLCFIALSDRGICGLSFVDEELQRLEFEAFSKKWNFAELIHAPDQTCCPTAFFASRKSTSAANCIGSGHQFSIESLGSPATHSCWCGKHLQPHRQQHWTTQSTARSRYRDWKQPRCISHSLSSGYPVNRKIGRLSLGRNPKKRHCGLGNGGRVEKLKRLGLKS